MDIACGFSFFCGGGGPARTKPERAYIRDPRLLFSYFLRGPLNKETGDASFRSFASKFSHCPTPL